MTTEEQVFETVTWAREEMTMKEFVDYFRSNSVTTKRGGVLVVTTSGHLGPNDEHDIGVDEVFWVYGIHRQKRLVVTDYMKRYLSIPSSYQLKMNVLNSSTLRKIKYAGKETVAVEEICDGLHNGEPIETAIFDGDCTVSFMFGTEQQDSDRLGILDIVDAYDEKFVLAFPILEHKVSTKTIAIPVYLPITLAVAERSSFGGNPREFKEWLDRVAQTVDSIPQRPVDTGQEIMVIDKKPEGGHYEYIRPTAAVFASNGQIAPPLPGRTGRRSSGSAVNSPKAVEYVDLPRMSPVRSPSVGTVADSVTQHPTGASCQPDIPPRPSRSDSDPGKFTKRPPPMPPAEAFTAAHGEGSSVDGSGSVTSGTAGPRRAYEGLTVDGQESTPEETEHPYETISNVCVRNEVVRTNVGSRYDSEPSRSSVTSSLRARVRHSHSVPGSQAPCDLSLTF